MLVTRVLALAAVGLTLGAADSWIRPVQLRMSAQPPTQTTVPGSSGAATQPDQKPAAPTPPAGVTAAPDAGATTVESAPVDAALGIDITLSQSKSLWDQGVSFIDARLKDEFLESRVEGAMHLTTLMFSEPTPPKALEFLDPSKPVVIYCGGGDCEASHSVGIRLQQSGFQRVHVMKDGFPAWKSAGHPVETGPDPLEASSGG
jgi:rhodanese-related sulfurtransferase